MEISLTPFSWVLGATLSGSGGSHTYYKPSSSAMTLSGDTWSIRYGDGSSASGNVYSDSVKVGGTMVKNQAVESANKASASFINGAGDGLLGLAFDVLNTGMSIMLSLQLSILTDLECSSTHKTKHLLHHSHQTRSPPSSLHRQPQSRSTGHLQLRLHRPLRLHRLHRLHPRRQLPRLLGLHAQRHRHRFR